jgi:PKHD-type hydroxylase
MHLFCPPEQASFTENDILCTQASVQGFMSRQECERVLALAEQLAAADGAYNVGADGSEHDDDTQIRKSRVRYLWPGEESRWLFEKLEYAVSQLNKSYRLDLSGFAEGVQVASYTDGGHYDWHSDLGPGFVSTRKLSLIVQLSDDDDYTGGEVEFVTIPASMPRTMGSLIAFPSYMVHRVAPVKTGMRKSLVSWVHGPAFR